MQTTIGTSSAATVVFCPVPIVLGVTGHRNVRQQDIAAIIETVRQVIQELRRDYPHTSLKLLSPLAAGADRLVARVALDEGVGLIVPLAWPPEHCPESIHRSGSREEFDELLARAELVIPLPLVEDVSAEDVCRSDAARDKQFCQVGAYLARHSQVLIALWDGVERPDSGTARVIAWQRRGELAPFASRIGHLDEPENGPVFHVTTPRDCTENQLERVELIKRYPENQAGSVAIPAAFAQVWQRIDDFNSTATQDSDGFRKQLAQSRDWLMPASERERLPAPLAGLLECYARADAASLHYQKQTRKTLHGLFAIVAVAVLCFEIYTHLLVDWWPLLTIYIVLLLASFAWYRWSHGKSQQARYLDYRALAEALRVQFFWRLGGLRASVVDSYLRNLRSELDWIRQAVRSCNLVTGGHERTLEKNREQTLERLRLVQTYWVDDQFRFFEKKAPANAKEHHRWAVLSTVTFWLAVGLACLALIAHVTTHHMNHVLAVAVFLSAAAAALCHEYAEKEAFSLQAKRYDWMRSLYGTARRELQSFLTAGDVDRAQELLLELGREALQENADWLLQHRQRPVKPPTI